MINHLSHQLFTMAAMVADPPTPTPSKPLSPPRPVPVGSPPWLQGEAQIASKLQQVNGTGSPCVGH